MYDWLLFATIVGVTVIGVMLYIMAACGRRKRLKEEMRLTRLMVDKTAEMIGPMDARVSILEVQIKKLRGL